jgi:multidrug efflux pump subunit AcrA (membrane-fusion protein)
MIRKYVIPVVAVIGVLFAIWTALQSAKPVSPAKPIAEPARSPYSAKISGSGIVEASTRNIAVGSALSGIVKRVFVSVGGKTKPGDPLFILDDRKQQADLAVREAALTEARSRLKRLQEAPRQEELPPAHARIKEAEANLEDLRFQLKIVEGIADKRAVSVEELSRRRYAVQAAEARFARARADLDLLEAGAWKEDLEVARADVARAEVEAGAARVEIDRLTVQAPVAGEILQVNIRPGEFAQSGVPVQPLLLLGNLDKMHVRVDIDENDAWRFDPKATAMAFIRGQPKFETGLTFEYVEPYVIPKRSLTGDSTERVDTRVIQVIYSFKRGALPVYPGQQMDVFIEDLTAHKAPTPAPASSANGGGKS